MNTDDMTKRPVVFAVASGGGHWVQLLRIAPGFDGCDVVYVSTIAGHAELVGDARFIEVPEANRWERWRAVRCALAMSWALMRIRPDIVVSTGALPGLFAVAFGKLVLRRPTIWIDSIANADELSMSGAQAGRFADLWLTQWEHLARPDGPTFVGSVLG